MLYSVEAQIGSGSSLVEVRNYSWAEPLDAMFTDDCPVFGLSLSPVPLESRARFHTTGPSSRFEPIGSMLYRPPNLPMQCRNAGGRQRLVMCSLPTNAMGSIRGDMAARLADLDPMIDLRDAQLAASMRRLAVEACHPGFGSEAMIEALTATLLVDFLRIAGAGVPTKAPTSGGMAPWQLRRIEEALREIDGNAPSVADLARLVGVSPRHLLRAFRASTGQPVAKHVQQMRTARACDLLTSSKLPIKVVAARCGYASAGAFATAFQRATGLTPRNYRSRAAR